MSHRQATRAHEASGDMAFRGAGVYPKNLVPAVRPGDYVRLEPSEDVYQVDVMAPQPGVLAFDSGDSNGVTVSTNGTNTDNQPIELEMPENWLAQYRPVHLGNDLDGDVLVTIDQGGQQAPMYTNKNFRGEWDEATATEIGNDDSSTVVSDAFNSNLVELYIHEDEVPYFTFEDVDGNNPTVSDIRFAGFQYRLDRATPPDNAHVEPVPTERVRE